MRKLMCFTIGFTAGCALGVWLLTGLWMLAVAGVFVAAFALLIFIHPDRTRKIIAVILLGAAVGLCWTFCYDCFYVDTARNYDGKTESVTIEVTDYVSLSKYGVNGTGKLQLDGKSYKVNFYLNEVLELYPGDTITGAFCMRFTGYGGEDSPTYHQGKGVLLLAYASESVSSRTVDKIPVKYFAANVRMYIIKVLNGIFPEDVAGFAKSLLLGDTSGLSDTDDTALTTSGIRHIVAVSGLHISILLSFVFVFSRGNRYAHAAIGIPVLVLFAAVAGFTPSVVRACIMQSVLIIGILFDDEYDAPSSLSLAVLIIIGVNPLAITSVSFQLSVGCVLGIMLFSRKIHDVLMRTKLGPAKGKSLRSKLIRAGVSSVSVTLSTLAVTLPISAYYFGTISTVSILTNMLTLWLVSMCFYGVVISVLVSLVFPSFAGLIAGLISWPMRLILLITKLISKIPFACVSVHNPYFLAWVIFCYVLFAVFLLSKKRRSLLFACLAVTGLCLSIIFAYFEPRMDQYRMTVLDVGQGQCIILQSKNSCYVVDCGGQEPSQAADLAAHTLRSCGIQRIDGLILTHFDSDHVGGAERFLAQIKADRIFVPDADEDSLYRLSLDEKYYIKKINKETTVDCGLGDITIFPGEKGATGNESSLCILFQVEDCDILITGDRNSAGERYLVDHANIPKLDVLVAGHHGAESSSSLYFLQKTQPCAVVISVGKDNSYGHPDQTILDRLKRFGSIIWRTDENGTIIIRG